MGLIEGGETLREGGDVAKSNVHRARCVTSEVSWWDGDVEGGPRETVSSNFQGKPVI